VTEEQEQRAWALGAALTDDVRQAEGRSLPGARLAQLVRQHDATLLDSMGLRLAELLDRYAPELTVVGHTGSDLVWGLGLEEDAPDVDANELLAPSMGRDDGRGDAIEWRSAHFENYRSLRDTSIDLENLTVLVGRNGAGKSNVLDGLFRASLLTRRKPEVVFRDLHTPTRITGRWAPHEGFAIRVNGSGDWSFEYRRAAPTEPAQSKPFTARTGGQERRLWSLLFTPLGDAFGGATYLRLDASKLQQPTWPRREEPFLRHDGLFLASVLAHVAQTDRARIDTIIGRVKELVPQVEDLRMPSDRLSGPGGTAMMGNALEVKMRGTGWTPADQLSEGTLLALGLITILTRPRPPRLLLLDDVDRGLHPSAQRRLILQLQAFASARTKIVCTSHSPYVLDPLPVEAVRVAIADEHSGATSVVAMADHPEWQKWSATMTPADFWQYVGDETWPDDRA